MKSINLLFLVVLFIAFSCATKEVVPTKTERIFKDAEIKSSSGENIPLEDLVSLEERVKTYWDARMDGNVAKMFELEDPDIIKEGKLTLQAYISSKAPAIVDKSYEVKEIEIVSPEKARVYILLTAFINLPQIMKEDKAIIKDIWNKKNGQWYRWFPLNPFSQIPGSEERRIKLQPYEGPVDDLKKGEKKLEIIPKEKTPPIGDIKEENK